ncbi:GDP/UDP-N,N'-diacetylbacillosamine 2-epimerase (hydrolysing) [Daejeonella rubra]|uniref:GDP/UDP-N,N'-diacetylbacillosamine 2-epimerase (Hydrolysing) n=1 Tax=Daejeonella rubra TaxID=990371 RepID=A0A1G9WUQ3_9SPHI|nr:UDP-N-acetylglucosamine 2-epimerase [Daejeonella rubra]SDM87836.1 GDP/UDP-N,N'-diacetylbacillosamine 2-epimerase (hydrolysing) [Daejeonella rubra]
MKVSVLTSSRADYSIYLPLLKALRRDPYFDLNIIAFGTHLSSNYGKTIDQITKDGFTVSKQVESMPSGDHSVDISEAMGKTLVNFSKIWENDDSDLVFALGDRFEMFAACASSVPFMKRIAHIHGGEITLGAIDDTFRNCISHMSTFHFATTDFYRDRLRALMGTDRHIYNVGALSIDNLRSLELMSLSAFKKKFKIDLEIPSVLITFHPETVNYEMNEFYIKELIQALNEVKNYQFIFTMPNADTMGSVIRMHIHEFLKQNSNVIAVESFGTIGYLTCMKYCSFMLGNTSSGFVEASYFPKYVINLGKRQEGRIISENIQNCEIRKDDILHHIHTYTQFKMPSVISLYGNGDTANKIVSIIKSENIE